MAAAIGRNPFNSRSDLLEKLWSKYQKETLPVMTKQEELESAIKADPTGNAIRTLSEAGKEKDIQICTAFIFSACINCFNFVFQ